MAALCSRFVILAIRPSCQQASFLNLQIVRGVLDGAGWVVLAGAIDILFAAALRSCFAILAVGPPWQQFFVVVAAEQHVNLQTVDVQCFAQANCERQLCTSLLQAYAKDLSAAFGCCLFYLNELAF